MLELRVRKWARCHGNAALILFLSCWTSAYASDFSRLCQSSMQRAESLFAECRQNARPFARNFYPSASRAPTPEEHRVWFNTTDPTEHFGLGCVLGPKQEIRFFGIYFFLDADKFRKANDASLTFVDFDGNVGLRAADGVHFTLLSVHRLTPPNATPTNRDGNCQAASLQRSNVSVSKVGDWYRIHRIDAGPPLTATYCLDREIRFEPRQCASQEVRSFVNNTESPIIYGEISLLVSEEGRLFVGRNIVRGLCERGTRPLLEYYQIVTEACSSVR